MNVEIKDMDSVHWASKMRVDLNIKVLDVDMDMWLIGTIDITDLEIYVRYMEYGGGLT